MIRAEAEPGDFDLAVRAGRFMPAFGIREVEHQLYTREGVGFSQADLETGVEVSAYLGPVTAQVALVNGSLGGPPFDSAGSSRSDFEMAVIARVDARAELGWARGQLGGSFYFSGNGNQANPLLARGIPPLRSGEVGLGVDEYRIGAFATANLGRFTYLGDVVYVRDDFVSDQLFALEGYASYQELSFVVIQGLDLVLTFEFADPDIEILNDYRMRVGGVIELFPIQYTELRLMVRHTWNDSATAGGGWDIVGFLHVFM